MRGGQAEKVWNSNIGFYLTPAHWYFTLIEGRNADSPCPALYKPLGGAFGVYMCVCMHEWVMEELPCSFKIAITAVQHFSYREYCICSEVSGCKLPWKSCISCYLAYLYHVIYAIQYVFFIFSNEIIHKLVFWLCSQADYSFYVFLIRLV